MTGGSDTQSKLRAAILAFVMVTSMMVGTVALTGTAAANSGINTADQSQDAGTLTAGQTATVQTVQLSDPDNDDGPATVTEVEIQDDGGNGLSEEDIASITILDETDSSIGSVSSDSALDNFDGTDGDGTEPVTISVSNFDLVDDGASKNIDVQVTLEDDVTADGVTLGLETQFVFDEDGDTDQTTGFVDDGTAESVNGLPTISSASTIDNDDDATVDQIQVTFDEGVTDSSLTDSGSNNQADDEFTVQVSGSQVDVTGFAGSTATDGSKNTVTLTLDTADSDLPSSDTGITPTVELAADSVTETAGAGQTGPNSATTVTASDGAEPVILSFTGSPSATSATLTFSEQVEDPDSANNPLEGSDLTYTDVNGAGVGDNSNAGDLGASPAASYTVALDSSIINSDLDTDTLSANADDPADNNNVGQTVTLQSTGLAGGSDNGVQYEVRGGDSDDAVVDLAAGSANESVGEIRLRDDSSDGDAAFAGQTIINLPDGVTVNESASSLTTQNVITTDAEGVTVDDISVNADGNIVLDHSGSSTAGETIRISSGAVVLSVDGNAIDTSTDSTTSLNLNVETFGGTASFSGAFQVSSPNVVSDDPNAVAINTDGQDLAGSTDDIEITSSEYAQSIEGDSSRVLIGNQTNIELTLESGTGVTFDTSSSVSFGNTEIDSDGTDELDPSQVSVSASTVTIPVVDSIDSANNNIQVQGLAVDANGSATDTNLNVSVTNSAPDTGAYVLDSSSGTPETFSNFVQINSPTVDVTAGDKDDKVVGLANQEPSGDLELDASSAAISAGSTAIISTNNSAVSFVNSNDGNGNIQPSDLGNANDISDLSINQNGDLVVQFDGNFNREQDLIGTNGDDDIDLEVGPSADDGALVQFEATIDDTVSIADTSNRLRLQRPNTNLNNDGNVTVDLDADGTTGVEFNGGDDNGVGNNNAIEITSDQVSGQVKQDTFVNITLEDNTGVSFDTRVTANALTDSPGPNTGTDGETDVSDDSGNNDISNVTITEDTIAIGINSGNGGLDSGETIRVDEVFLNATSGAGNTTLTVTTNTGDNTVTTDFEKRILTNPVDPNNVFADADVSQSDSNGDASPNPAGVTAPDYGTSTNDEAQIGEQPAETKPAVDSTVTSEVYVVDGNAPFGGATVNLEVVQTPDGASGQSLNTTSLTTDSNGLAAFEFTTGDTDGTYVVNASTDAGGVNITYVVQPGAVDGVTVTPVENAIAGDSSELGTASVFVNATDANGNPVQQSATVTVTADNVGASGVTAFDDLAADGTGTNNQDNLNDGEFSIDSNDGSSVIDVDSDQVEDVTITATISGNSDSGTVTFFDQVGQVDLALNQSTVEVDDTVAAEATISEGDGTTIEVPDVTVNYDDNNGANTTFAGGADSDSASTSDAGVASVNVTAEQLGSSTIDAQSNLRSANATLNIVENAGAQVQLANVNLDPSSVSANTTNDHDLTFDAVNVSDDGNTDSFTVTIPSAATLESANSVSVVDANGTDVSLSGGPDVSGNEITFDVAPDSSADTRTLSVTANVTVAAPDVENETTADITVDVSDSNNGQASANATLTVEPADAPVSDPVDRFDTNGEPGIQDDEVLNAISAFNEGEEGVEDGDVLDVISAFNEA